MFLRATQAYTIKESTWKERRNPVLSWIQVFGWWVSYFLLGIPFSSPPPPLTPLFFFPFSFFFSFSFIISASAYSFFSSPFFFSFSSSSCNQKKPMTISCPFQKDEYQQNSYNELVMKRPVWSLPYLPLGGSAWPPPLPLFTNVKCPRVHPSSQCLFPTHGPTAHSSPTELRERWHVDARSLRIPVTVNSIDLEWMNEWWGCGGRECLGFQMCSSFQGTENNHGRYSKPQLVKWTCGHLGFNNNYFYGLHTYYVSGTALGSSSTSSQFIFTSLWGKHVLSSFYTEETETLRD